MAVLLNAFGLSLSEGRPPGSLGYSPTEPLWKSSVGDWTRKVLGGEAKL